MDLTMYCDNLASELGGWKSKLGRIATEFGQISTGDKSGVLAQVNELNMVLEEFDDRIEGLRTRCSTEWEQRGGQFAGTMARPDIPDKSAYENMSPAEFGG